MAISGHFDLPARAGVLEQVTYVGHDSCSFCDEHGEVVKTNGRGHVMTFPFRNTPSGHAEPRDAVDVKAHAHEALETNATVSYLYCTCTAVYAFEKRQNNVIYHRSSEKHHFSMIINIHYISYCSFITYFFSLLTILETTFR